ncbi:hypothetical protein [Streptomyces jumonjinensis]|uniref:Uncharacterized protein n=1 Tax=Streptomyces jumonjinensis TaxID=1945 RepID=A0A646KNM3_STRJU|nr:hypothetical protein [Streptomyces jumonjinensis]MQT03892.1 hypothetical protein [Streptomyces jumonjinensis]
MSDRSEPVAGPIPIYVRTIPAGVVLDLEGLTERVVGDVLDALLDSADTDLWDRLTDLATETRTPEEGRLPFEELVSDLTERASSRVPLYGTKARVLAKRLTAATRKQTRRQTWRRVLHWRGIRVAGVRRIAEAGAA